MSAGRPSIFTQELADEICEHLALGESIRTVCALEQMPSVQTFFRWLREKSGFNEQYAHAKEEAADAMAEEILYISDNTEVGEIVITKPDKTGKLVTETRKEDMLGHRRLQVDTRKFLMAKMKPKKYGEKLDLTSGGKRIQRGMSLEEINEILARAEATKSPETDHNISQTI